MPDPKGKIVVPCGLTASDILRALKVDSNDYLYVNDAGTSALLGLLTFDGSGNLLVKDSAAETQLNKLNFDVNGHLEVTEATVSERNVRDHSYINGAWQKQPVIEGFSDQIWQVKSFVLVASTGTVSSDTVPAGEYWKIVSICAAFGAHACTRLSFGVDKSAVLVNLQDGAAAAVGLWKTWTGNAYLIPGDKITAAFEGCTAGDTIYMRCHGVRVDIDL